jgi:hypothetical protein
MREYKIAGEELEPRRPVAVAPQRSAEIEKSLDQLSRWMDGLFRIPGVGWRFGLDALVGLIPGVGDTLSSLVSFYILAAGVRYGVPKVTLLRMGANLGIDYLLGSIPFLGDLFDFAWKANEMNVALIRERATVKTPEEARKGRMSDWLFLSIIILILIAILAGSLTLAYLMIRFITGQLSNLF